MRHLCQRYTPYSGKMAHIFYEDRADPDRRHPESISYAH